MGLDLLFLFLGLIVLILGGDFLVRGASSIALKAHISPLVVGLTIVAFGTSLPELATSVVAAMRGEMDISIGNLVGSNVFNILSVIGATAIVRPITVPGGFIGSGLVVDYLVMMFTSALPWFMMRKDLTLSRGNGLALLSCYVGYVGYLVVKG